MSNFILDNTSPGNEKTNYTTRPEIPSDQKIGAGDWNTYRQAFLDIQSFLRGAPWSSLVAQAADPAPASITNYVWLKTDNTLHVKIGGVDHSINLDGIADNSVTLAKLADIATARILGRTTAGSGDPEELTGTQATTLLDVFTSALKGLVPASGGGTANFLRADGAWAAVSDTLGADGDKGDVTVGGSGTTLTIDSNAVTLAKLADIASARIIGRTTAGSGDPEELTGAQATSILDVIRVYNVKRAPYSAVGDGVADDRPAIQAAVDAANAAGGGVVYFPNGTYRVTRTSVPLDGCIYIKSNVTLLGESQAGVIIKQADDQTAFTRVLRVDVQSDWVIRNLTVDGNKAGTAVPEEHMAGIFAGGTTGTVRWHIDHVTMRNCCGDGMQMHTGCEDGLIENCRVHDNDRAGISLTGLGAKRVTIRKCHLIDNADQQIDCEMAGAGFIEDLSIIDCYLAQRAGVGGVGLTISGFGSSNQLKGATVTGNVLLGGVYIWNATKVRFVNNRLVVPNDGTPANAISVINKSVDVLIANNQILANMAVVSSPGAIYLQGLLTGTDEKPTDVRIENNYIETDQNASGVLLNGARSAMIVNNRIVGNATVASTRCGVTCLLSDATAGVPPQMDTLIVRGNWITDFGTGIMVSPSGANDADHQITELLVTDNILQRVNHASMVGLELNRNDDRGARSATVLGNTTINITTFFGTNGWPFNATLIAGNRGFCGMYTGAGSPEGVVTERPGALYIQRNGIAGAILFRKEAGTGNTGWIEVDDGDSPNLVRNSGFLLAQRQAPATPTTYSNTTGRSIAADGWGITNQSASVEFSRVDTVGALEAGLLARFYGKFTKITNAGKVIASQVIEGARVAHVRGKKVRLSLKLRMLTNAKTIRVGLAQLTSSGTLDTIPATFISAIGADGVDPTLGTNLAYIAPGAGLAELATVSGGALSCSVTTAWQRFSGVFTVPTTAKNLVVLVFNSDSMAIADAFCISEVCLAEGAVTWREPLIQDEIDYARRFYQKTFVRDTAPAQNVGVGTGELVDKLAYAGATASAAVMPWRFAPEMRAAPTVTLYNPAAANAEVRQTGGTPSDLTASAAGETTAVQTVITATGVAAGVAGDRVAVHATADAEL